MGGADTTAPEGGTVDTYTVMLLVAGAIPGFLVGRWSAEYRRARADMRGIWNNRKKYRS